MKIGQNADKLAAAGLASGVERPATAEAGRSKGASEAGPVKNAPEASARLALSSTASTMLQGVPDDGSFDAEKVQRISQAISEGKFSINAEAVADKLIANAREMVGRVGAH
ncbi:flagellar biosynthesis anti-sigma factor FlgM [Pelomonas sp. APW6]|uniref:Negative regulator of flagellin synthesis n=1 Tax=Roseateles subflavus TaxID=3053353 RepID=A0ABT7LL89_9BURK|nr:flagellar biosynthesis anti-sigma factor FlgM [Pelomonas sp. APW6]MDL5033637.1 flagellar biosynthesis anti-sigma factor FlgM [Pelomonas sp. APW6]